MAVGLGTGVDNPDERTTAASAEGEPATPRVPALVSLRAYQGEQRAGVVDVSAFVHSGPRPVWASGVLIIASGPAL
jgi:hypothetical protein